MIGVLYRVARALTVLLAALILLAVPQVGVWGTYVWSNGSAMFAVIGFLLCNTVWFGAVLPTMLDIYTRVLAPASTPTLPLPAPPAPAQQVRPRKTRSTTLTPTASGWPRHDPTPASGMASPYQRAATPPPSPVQKQEKEAPRT